MRFSSDSSAARCASSPVGKRFSNAIGLWLVSTHPRGSSSRNISSTCGCQFHQRLNDNSRSRPSMLSASCSCRCPASPSVRDASESSCLFTRRLRDAEREKDREGTPARIGPPCPVRLSLGWRKNGRICHSGSIDRRPTDEVLSLIHI